MKKFHAVLWKEDDWYIARALEVEVTTQGQNEKEALANLKEALELYFEDNSEAELIEVKQPKLQDVSVQMNA